MAQPPRRQRLRAALAWGGLALAVAVPLFAASQSPLLAWRQPVYIGAGFAGIVGLCLLLVQPLLIGRSLPGLPPVRARRLHRWTGAALVLSVMLHVAGLWITSPPDVVDVLLFRSPTPFSLWGVIAMWAVFAAAALAALRRPVHLPVRSWRRAHITLAGVTVAGTVVHALLIEGTMETMSKVALCLLAVLAWGHAVVTVAKRGRARPHGS